MRISTAAQNSGKFIGGSYLRTSLSLMLAVALVLSGNAENSSQVRKRVLGIGFSPESSTSFGSDDIDTVMQIEPEAGDSEDDTIAPIISDGMVVDEATLSPIVTKKAEKSSKKEKESKAPTTKSSATKKPKEPTKKSTIVNKLKVSTASKLPKEASKVDGKQRKLGIGFVPPTPDSSDDDDNEDIPISSDGMVEDGATTESVEADVASKKSKAPIEFKSSKTSKKKATKSPTTESSEALDYGAVDFGSTEEPTSFATFISSSFTFGPTGTFDPTSFPTGSPTRTPTGTPTGTPTEAPTKPFVIPKSSKKTKAPEASKKDKAPTNPKKK